MRGGLYGLPVAHPIGEQLPAVYADDDFAQRMTLALDDVLAPLFATLDCLPDYFDPILAPPDFVEWLSDWVAFSLDEGWTLAQRRALVADAVELHRLRGTARGLEKHVRLLSLGDVEIVETGSCTVSAQPRSSVPSPEPHVEVLVTVSDPATVDGDRLLATIVEAAPAHVTVSLTIMAADPGRSASGRASARASVRSAPASGSARVPMQAPPPAPDGSGTQLLKQPSPRVSGVASVPPPAALGPARPGSSPPVSASAAEDARRPTGPPPQPGRGRVRGIARPPGLNAPDDPAAPPSDGQQ